MAVSKHAYYHSLASSIEGGFDFGRRVYDIKNANPMDLIEARRPVNCAARAFIVATALGEILDDGYSVRFSYHRDHKRVDRDGKLLDLPGATRAHPKMFIAHARVEIDDGNFEPYAIDLEYAQRNTPTIRVGEMIDTPGTYGSTFIDPVSGLKQYCEGHTGLTEFDLADIDRAHEILITRYSSANLEQAA